MSTLPLSHILLSVAFITATCAIAASGAQAADKSSAEAKRNEQLETRFKKADANGDGKLSMDEAKTGMPRVYKNFDKIKTGNNDYVTLDEIKAAMKSGN